MTVDGILRGQHYNSVRGTLDFLDDEGEVLDRVPFREVGLVDGRMKTSTTQKTPSRRLDDISSVTLGPGLKFSQWRSKP
ncbi:hypothetical protein [Streptomyces sp. SID14478]|uniref:hypothetical protein n=1 Tax=Streptomyces sp. SID14478 TaxID=2706073 RepID=UPI0013DB684E|nr:hypothetical protein [Streptomyces sp. SID14478]